MAQGDCIRHVSKIHSRPSSPQSLCTDWTDSSRPQQHCHAGNPKAESPIRITAFRQVTSDRLHPFEGVPCLGNQNLARPFSYLGDLLKVEGPEEEVSFMQKTLMAALAATCLVLAAASGATAAPVAPIGKAANAMDARSSVHYYRYGYYHQHRHCWWRYGRRICRW